MYAYIIYVYSCNAVDPLNHHLVFCLYRNGDTFCVRRGSFTIGKTVKPKTPKP